MVDALIRTVADVLLPLLSQADRVNLALAVPVITETYPQLKPKLWPNLRLGMPAFAPPPNLDLRPEDVADISDRAKNLAVAVTGMTTYLAVAYGAQSDVDGFIDHRDWLDIMLHLLLVAISLLVCGVVVGGTVDVINDCRRRSANKARAKFDDRFRIWTGRSANRLGTEFAWLSTAAPAEHKPLPLEEMLLAADKLRQAEQCHETQVAKWRGMHHPNGVGVLGEYAADDDTKRGQQELEDDLVQSIRHVILGAHRETSGARRVSIPGAYNRLARARGFAQEPHGSALMRLVYAQPLSDINRMLEALAMIGEYETIPRVSDPDSRMSPAGRFVNLLAAGKLHDAYAVFDQHLRDREDAAAKAAILHVYSGRLNEDLRTELRRPEPFFTPASRGQIEPLTRSIAGWQAMLMCAAFDDQVPAWCAALTASPPSAGSAQQRGNLLDSVAEARQDESGARLISLLLSGPPENPAPIASAFKTRYLKLADPEARLTFYREANDALELLVASPRKETLQFLFAATAGIRPALQEHWRSAPLDLTLVQTVCIDPRDVADENARLHLEVSALVEARLGPSTPEFSRDDHFVTAAGRMTLERYPMKLYLHAAPRAPAQVMAMQIALRQRFSEAFAEAIIALPIPPIGEHWTSVDIVDLEHSATTAQDAEGLAELAIDCLHRQTRSRWNEDTLELIRLAEQSYGRTTNLQPLFRAIESEIVPSMEITV